MFDDYEKNHGALPSEGLQTGRRKDYMVFMETKGASKEVIDYSLKEFMTKRHR